jgi:RNA polymerase primary sigma factor
VAAKKATGDIKLSDELQGAVERLVSRSRPEATRHGGRHPGRHPEIDVDGDELSDLYDALRAKGVEIATSGEARQIRRHSVHRCRRRR